jgi:hypothetical protein
MKKKRKEEKDYGKVNISRKELSCKSVGLGSIHGKQAVIHYQKRSH